MLGIIPSVEALNKDVLATTCRETRGSRCEMAERTGHVVQGGVRTTVRRNRGPRAVTAHD